MNATMKKRALFLADIGESTDISALPPEMVKQLQAESEKARAALGDVLTNRPGAERREPGHLTETKPRLSLGAAGATR